MKFTELRVRNMRERERKREVSWREICSEQNICRSCLKKYFAFLGSCAVQACRVLDGALTVGNRRDRTIYGSQIEENRELSVLPSGRFMSVISEALAVWRIGDRKISCRAQRGARRAISHSRGLIIHQILRPFRSTAVICMFGNYAEYSGYRVS